MEYSEPSFSVENYKQFILIKTSGNWNLSADIAYLSEAASALTARKGQPFYVVVDMRGWHVSDEVKYATIKENLILDRRGQRAECWLMDNHHQAIYLLPYFSNFKFSLSRCVTVDEVTHWFENNAEHPVDDFIANWLHK